MPALNLVAMRDVGSLPLLCRMSSPSVAKSPARASPGEGGRSDVLLINLMPCEALYNKFAAFTNQIFQGFGTFKRELLPSTEAIVWSRHGAPEYDFLNLKTGWASLTVPTGAVGAKAKRLGSSWSLIDWPFIHPNDAQAGPTASGL